MNSGMKVVRRCAAGATIALYLGIFAAGLLAAPAWAAGPSFDCAAARLADERAICASSELSALEFRASESFRHVRDAVDAQAAKKIAFAALKSRRACGTQIDCIRDVLTSAIGSYSELENSAQAPASDSSSATVAPADLQPNSIENTCLRKWDTDPNFSNSAYKDCITAMTEARFGQLDGSACDDRACYYRLSAVQVDGLEDESSVYQGSGYFVRYKPADYGRDILVLDVQGGLTVFGQCGTCNGLEYSSGPLSTAILRAMSQDMILEVSRDQLAKLTSPAAAQAAPAQADGNSGFAMQENRDFAGTDMQTIRNSSQPDCISACTADANCQGLSYDKWNRFCFLKSAVVSARLDPHSISGVRQSLAAVPASSTPIQMQRYRGKVFPDQGYRTVQSPEFTGCESTCRQEAQCVAFSYRKTDSSCRLMQSTEQYTSDSGFDSGIKVQP